MYRWFAALLICLLLCCGCNANDRDLSTVRNILEEQLNEKVSEETDQKALYDFAAKNREKLRMASADEWIFLDKFLIRNNPEYTPDIDQSIRDEQEAVKFTQALTKETGDELTAKAQKEYKSVFPDEETVSWISYNINDYAGFNAKELVPGKHIVIDVKSRGELGEGAYMSFCYAKESGDSDWSLVNYGY